MAYYNHCFILLFPNIGNSENQILSLVSNNIFSKELKKIFVHIIYGLLPKSDYLKRTKSAS